MKAIRVIIINIAVAIVGGLLVISFMRFFVPIDWFSVILSFAGAATGSLAVDLFRWFRVRCRVVELHEDVVQVIDEIFEKNVNGHNSKEIGYIKGRNWTLPLTPKQIAEMNKALYVKSN